jgi:hypothetical protein
MQVPQVEVLALIALLASTQVPRVKVLALIVLLASTQVPRDRQPAHLVLMAAIHPAQDHRLVRMPHLVALVRTAQVIYVPSAHTVLMAMVLVGLALQAGTRLPQAR